MGHTARAYGGDVATTPEDHRGLDWNMKAAVNLGVAGDENTPTKNA